jgi:hypothetical protein
VHFGSSQLLLSDVLHGHTLNNIRTGQEHVAAVAHLQQAAAEAYAAAEASAAQMLSQSTTNTARSMFEKGVNFDEFSHTATATYLCRPFLNPPTHNLVMPENPKHYKS